MWWWWIGCTCTCSLSWIGLESCTCTCRGHGLTLSPSPHFGFLSQLANLADDARNLRYIDPHGMHIHYTMARLEAKQHLVEILSKIPYALSHPVGVLCRYHWLVWMTHFLPGSTSHRSIA